MSGPQWIFLILIAIVTWGAFVESSTDKGYRLTPGRFAVALALPLAVAALVAFVPWSEWPAALPSHAPLWMAALSLLLIPLGILLIITVPPAFVFAIVIWIAAATTGEMRSELRGLAQRIGRRIKRRAGERGAGRS